MSLEKKSQWTFFDDLESWCYVRANRILIATRIYPENGYTEFTVSKKVDGKLVKHRLARNKNNLAICYSGFEKFRIAFNEVKPPPELSDLLNNLLNIGDDACVISVAESASEAMTKQEIYDHKTVVFSALRKWNSQVSQQHFEWVSSKYLVTAYCRAFVNEVINSTNLNERSKDELINDLLKDVIVYRTNR